MIAAYVEEAFELHIARVERLVVLLCYHGVGPPFALPIDSQPSSRPTICAHVQMDKDDVHALAGIALPHMGTTSPAPQKIVSMGGVHNI